MSQDPQWTGQVRPDSVKQRCRLTGEASMGASQESAEKFEYANLRANVCLTDRHMLSCDSSHLRPSRSASRLPCYWSNHDPLGAVGESAVRTDFSRHSPRSPSAARELDLPWAVHVDSEREVMRWASPTRSPNHRRSRCVSRLQDQSWADSLQSGPLASRRISSL